jgi:hypothetical protein
MVNEQGSRVDQLFRALPGIKSIGQPQLELLHVLFQALAS